MAAQWFPAVLGGAVWSGSMSLAVVGVLVDRVAIAAEATNALKQLENQRGPLIRRRSVQWAAAMGGCVACDCVLLPLYSVLLQSC